MKRLQRLAAIGGVAIGLVALAIATHMAMGCGAGISPAPANGNESLPTAVEGVTAAPGYGKVTTSWTAAKASENVTSYTLYIGTSADVAAALSDASVTKVENATSPYVHTVDCGTTYYYAVTATNSVGEGSASSVVSATPAAAGVLDTSFADAGTFIAEDDLYDGVWGLVVDAQKRPVFTGVSGNNAVNPDATTWRLTEAGALDPTFGTAAEIPGKILYPGGEHENFYGGMNIAFDSTGRVVVAGSNSNHLFVLRYTTDGVLDTGFGTNGYVELPDSSPVSNIAIVGLAIDGLNGIAVAGRQPDGEENYLLAVWHLTEGGENDWSFSYPNIVNDQATAAAVDASGNIVVTGSHMSGPGAIQMILLRLTPSGELDTSFNGSGVVIYSGGTVGSIGFGLAFDSSGRILVAGTNVEGEESYQYAVWRYNTNGTADTSFNGSGIVTGTLSGNPLNYGMSVLVDAVGGITVSLGYGNPLTTVSSAFARFQDDGTADASFGSEGILENGIVLSPNTFAQPIAASYGCLYLGVSELVEAVPVDLAHGIVRKFK